MKRQISIPAITTRPGKVSKPSITLGDVLNYIDHADQRQSEIILNAMRSQPWYVPNQLNFAFGGFKVRRAAV